VDAGNCPFAFAAFASDTEDELWDDVEEFAFGSELVDFLLDFGSFVVLDGHVCPLGYCVI
jgi:hypothetical protein